MDKEIFNRIIDEVYNHYLETHQYEPFILQEEMNLSKEEFIKKITNNYGFGQLFGISLNERELSLEERMGLCKEKWDYSWNRTINLEDIEWRMNNEWNIPSKLITITYNDKTIESYE
jgi:hypothetical protein